METQLLKTILRLLIVIAKWMMDSKEADYRTRETWFAMRDGITAAQKELQ